MSIFSLMIKKIKYFKNKINKLIKRNTKSSNLKYPDFFRHEEFIKEKFGIIDKPYDEKVLKEDFLRELIDYLNKIKPFDDESLIYESQRYDPLMQITNISENDLKKLSKILKNCMNLNPLDPTIKRLHENIREVFKNYFKSPITFVNSRAWVTPAQSEKFGPNALHLDGFAPGHLKIMIYPLGLSHESGEILIENNSITNKPPGYMLAFKNSDVFHAGVPGLSEKRIAIEITIMRTIISNIQLNQSHFFGRHLNSPLTTYYLANRTRNNLLSLNYMEKLFKS